MQIFVTGSAVSLVFTWERLHTLKLFFALSFCLFLFSIQKFKLHIPFMLSYRRQIFIVIFNFKYFIVKLPGFFTCHTASSILFLSCHSADCLKDSQSQENNMKIVLL